MARINKSMWYKECWIWAVFVLVLRGNTHHRTDFEWMPVFWLLFYHSVHGLHQQCGFFFSFRVDFHITWGKWPGRTMPLPVLVLQWLAHDQFSENWAFSVKKKIQPSGSTTSESEAHGTSLKVDGVILHCSVMTSYSEKTLGLYWKVCCFCIVFTL